MQISVLCDYNNIMMRKKKYTYNTKIVFFKAKSDVTNKKNISTWFNMLKYCKRRTNISLSCTSSPRALISNVCLQISQYLKTSINGHLADSTIQGATLRIMLMALTYLTSPWQKTAK